MDDLIRKAIEAHVSDLRFNPAASQIDQLAKAIAAGMSVRFNPAASEIDQVHEADRA